MATTKCPACKETQGFEISPSFQTNLNNEVVGADLSVKCKNCGKEFPIIRSSIYEHIDTITKFVMELKNKKESQ